MTSLDREHIEKRNVFNEDFGELMYMIQETIKNENDLNNLIFLIEEFSNFNKTISKKLFILSRGL